MSSEECKPAAKVSVAERAIARAVASQVEKFHGKMLNYSGVTVASVGDGSPGVEDSTRTFRVNVLTKTHGRECVIPSTNIPRSFYVHTNEDGQILKANPPLDSEPKPTTSNKWRW
jgi:hypothetical protein